MSITRARIASRDARAGSVDLLKFPLVGRFLRWPRSRAVMQIPVLLISLVMIIHGLAGPSLAPRNLATLLTWVHFRGLVVLAILLAGNLFCMACPFMLPRELARRLALPRFNWPKSLRNKWPAIGLFVLVLYLYELFDLWADPWWTAVLIVAYFLAALVVDSLFRRASFCKYVCPIGQFNFLGSTLSPLQVSTRDPSVCLDCRTKDCIRGRRAAGDRAEPGEDATLFPVIERRGCELALFQQRKVGNLDCTFCLDCVYACPHDNVGIIASIPGEELTFRGVRSGLGRIESRFDFTALIAVFTFGAVLNALAMVSPVYALEQAIADVTGLRTEWPILAGLFAVGLVIEPAVLLCVAAAATRWGAGLKQSTLVIVNRFARSLVPIGFGVWLAHYGFHFFTGVLTVVPVVQYAVLHATGRAWWGEPMWQLGGLPESIVGPMEIGFLVLGLAGSWLVGWSIAADEAAPRRAMAAFLPWAAVHLMLFVSALWIMNQPMEMRGTFLGG